MPRPRPLPAASPMIAMSRRALVFQHFKATTPGRINVLLEAMDIRCDVVALHRGDEIPSLASYDVMLVLHGPRQRGKEEFPWLLMEKESHPRMGQRKSEALFRHLLRPSAPGGGARRRGRPCGGAGDRGDDDRGHG